MEAVEEPERHSRIMRELASLALIALVIFTILSLVCLDAGRHPNLGGPLGASLASTLGYAFGYQAYVIAILVALLALRVSSHTRIPELIREIFGGTLVVVSLSAIGGLVKVAGIATGGQVGAGIAGTLRAYVNVGGGMLAVMVALVVGLAMMLKRAPTDLVPGLAGALRGRKDATPEEAEDGDETPVTRIAIPSRDSPTPDIQTPLVRRPEAASADSRETGVRTQPRLKGGYKLPPNSLLDPVPSGRQEIDEGALERSARLLEQKLADFGITGQVVEVQPGPVVTMYKLEPGSGIKVSQIVNLADDLSMAMRAATVRILAPVPGEAVVGIEVPNRKREKVYLREILEAPEFSSTHGQLMIALGKDIAGRPVAADLATMPHLLIAGATGTGKSVSIHTMISSILFNATADDVRFILIDPKMLELSVYEGIPHLLVPVVVDPEKAAAALLWATREMESRYRMMRDLGVRNIDGYNRALAQKGTLVELGKDNSADGASETSDESASAPRKHHKLPKIVIVIDELADLLLSEGKTVERDITRLAQKARAAGIHLILATQRPSVDVITGLIKANLPARISFQVTSRVDSRTILDSIGAERLLGAGDMLFMPPGTAKLRRLHGPFVSEAEIRRVADFLRAQGSPDYQMEILETTGPREGEGENGGEKDELYDEALRIVMENGQASISMIQRRLRIGYNRAARMVEQMEQEGLLMPADGARPRELRMRGTG